MTFNPRISSRIDPFSDDAGSASTTRATPHQDFKAARQAGPDVPPLSDAQPARVLGWLIEQPNAFQLREEILAALMGIQGSARDQLAAACEAKLFPTANSLTGLTRDKMAMLRMLQSIYARG